MGDTHTNTHPGNWALRGLPQGGSQEARGACYDLPWHCHPGMQPREELSRTKAHRALGDNLPLWPHVQGEEVDSPRSQGQWVVRQQKEAPGYVLHETPGLESCCHYFLAVVTSLNLSAPQFSHLSYNLIISMAL